VKVLLIQPPQGTDFGFTNVLRVEPLGLECVGAALLEAGHDVDIVDMRLDGWSQLQSRCESQGPDAVGVACQFMTDVYPALHVGAFVRSLNPGVKIFTGGHHASLCPHDVIFDQSPFDALVQGEGEATAVELLAAFEENKRLENVPGAVTPANVRTGAVPRPLVPDLDSLPLPARHLTARYRGKYHQGSKAPSACAETARGCPYDCNFCSVWIFFQRRCRMRSPETILRDFTSITEPNIFITDDIAFLHSPTYETLGRALKAERFYRLITLETRCDLVVKHRDLFELWRSVGLDSVFLGVEKVDDYELEAIRKRTNRETNTLAIRTLREIGIRPYAAFIIDPDWDESDFDRLEAYIEALELEQPSFTVLTPFPGTDYYRAIKDRIVEDNYLMFDTVHAVLPTRLPIERFYERFARLYDRTARWDLGGLPALKTAFRLASHRRLFVFRRLLRALRHLRNPDTYLKPPFEKRPPGAPPLAPNSASSHA